LAALPFFFWVAWRRRSTAPLVMLVAALVLLNLTVGVVKYAIGRVGPAHINDVHMIFAGGNIYPSGHVSNTVVLYGLIAWLTPRFRKTIIAVAVLLCVSVGIGTIYLRTHWFSDVIGGWFAGGLVLLALPTVMPAAQRCVDSAIAWARSRFARDAEVAMPVPRIVPHAPPIAPRLIHRSSTPVSSAARSHSFAATSTSFDALDEPTRLG
jgi:membrane-associated phospholipid phosphatase